MGITLKVTKDKAVLKDSVGGASFIARSGIYPITIRFVSLEETKNGAVKFNINLDYKGNQQTIYGNNIINTNGQQNKIGMELLNKLCLVCGMDEGKIQTETEEHKVGKEGKLQEFEVIPELSDKECMIQVKEVFTKYQGEVRSNLEIYNFFSKDGATALELASKEEDDSIELGAQLKKLQAMEATTKYIAKASGNEPAPTEEEIQEYIASRGKKSTTPKPTVKKSSKASKLFD